MSENNISNGESLPEDISVPIEKATKTWVQFEDETSDDIKGEPAVITTENVQVLERSFSKPSPDHVPNTDNDVSVMDPKPMRNVELPIATVEPIRQGFANGDVIVTLLPVNTKFPWITPAKFRPELVPEELMAQGLTLTVEEYVQAMELLVNDFRFTLYNICYKRVLVLWILIAFIVLFGVLFSNQTGATLFVLGIGWLMFNAAAIFFSMWVKFKLTRNLEKCLAHVNKQLLRHRIVIALDDRGKISCHKVTLCFLYMDSGPCINHLQSSIDQQERDQNSGWEQKMDITANDIVIQGSRTTRLSRKQERATLLYLRYIARWGKEVVRGYVVSPPAKGGRHCHSLTCPCQYIDEHLYCKPPGPTVLSLKKHFRKSLSFDQFERVTPNASLSIIEISSSDSGCSNSVRPLESCSQIIIDSSSREIGNALQSDISPTYNFDSDNEEVILPSPNRKKLNFECVSTSKKKDLNKLDCKKITKTKLSEIMKWMENVDECNENVIKNENIQSIEGSLPSYDDFKYKTKGKQVLNSTMIPNLMKNDYCTDQEINKNCIDMIHRQKADFENSGGKLSYSNDNGFDCNKSCEDLLDDLYGDSWRLKKDEVLSKSEKKPRKKKTEMVICPNSERKPIKSDLDKEKLTQNNLLRTLQTRIFKKANDSPYNKNLWCDEKQYNDGLKSITRDLFNCTDKPKKKTGIQMSKYLDKQIQSFGFTDLKKYDDDGNNSNLSDKENISCREINPSEYRNGKTKSDGADNKLKENDKIRIKNIRKDTKTTIINKKGTKKNIFNGINDESDVSPDSKYISSPIEDEEESCSDIDEARITRKKSTECYSGPIDYNQDKLTLNYVQEKETFNQLKENSYSFLASLSKNIPDSQCDISAKIYRSNYKQHKENLANKLFNLYNEKIFDNALPDTTVLEWNNRMSTTAGFCCSKKITHRSGDVERVTKIVLSTKVLDSADRLRDTMIHEMCHAATWIVNQVSNGHGEYWIAWTIKARQIFPELPPIKRCHNYQLNTKYVYRCTGCSYSIGRHRKSLDIERKRCGYCLGKFEVLLNKINKKGEQKMVPVTAKREPNGFALFVKENYSNFKEPGVNHASVMKLLGEKFKEMKV